MDAFWSAYGVDGAAEPAVALVGDGAAGARGGVESMLDIEYVNAGGAGIHSEFWGFAGRAPDDAENEPFMKWLYTLGNTSDAAAPKVFSTSYGEDEDSTSWEYANRMNAEFMKAGARGISLLYASGDEGANCERPARFAPEWPSSSPYVTAVGGTTYAAGGAETAASLSSGGFSARWAMPAWQRDAVGAYVAAGAGVSGFPAAWLYNATGRAYPDVAAQAEGYVVVCDGQTLPGVAGTSCATPAFSGVVALLVDRRLAAGKSALGFLNPLLYSDAMTRALNDVTSGAGRGCAAGPGKGGWPALVGWDAVTGWGTPNMGKMAAVIDALP